MTLIVCMNNYMSRLEKKALEEDNQKFASKKMGFIIYLPGWIPILLALFLMAMGYGFGGKSLYYDGKHACFGLRFPRSITGKNHPTKSNHSNPTGEAR